MGSAAKEFSFFDRQTKCPFLALCFYIFTLFSFASFSWRVDAFLLPSASFTAVSKATVTGGKDNAVQANTSIRGKINPLQATTIPSSDILTQDEQAFLPPWEFSIVDSNPLKYNPLLTHQLEILFSRLVSLKQYPVPADLQYREAQNNQVGRIATLCFQSKEFKKIRISYVDCGEAFHVFNILMEPIPELDIPMFGAEFLSIGQRHLVVVDFLPMFEDKSYIQKYIDPLNDIKQSNPHLIGDLSGKHYDDARFFSHNMLFARQIGEPIDIELVRPAFEQYLELYIDLALRTTPNADAEFVQKVQAKHKEFADYSAAKDPAKGLFQSWFGKEWGESYSKFIH